MRIMELVLAAEEVLSLCLSAFLLGALIGSRYRAAMLILVSAAMAGTAAALSAVLGDSVAELIIIAGATLALVQSGYLLAAFAHVRWCAPG